MLMIMPALWVFAKTKQKSPHFSSGHNSLNCCTVSSSFSKTKNPSWLVSGRRVTQKCQQSSPLLHSWREFQSLMVRGKKEPPLYCVLVVVRLSCWQCLYNTCASLFKLLPMVLFNAPPPPPNPPTSSTLYVNVVARSDTNFVFSVVLYIFQDWLSRVRMNFESGQYRAALKSFSLQLVNICLQVRVHVYVWESEAIKPPKHPDILCRKEGGGGGGGRKSKKQQKNNWGHVFLWSVLTTKQ